MGISPENLDKLKQGKRKQMSDVATANYLVRSIGGGGRVCDFIYHACEKLNEMFPHNGDASKQWTQRRLRGWWNNDSDKVLHWQMVELYEAAAKAKEESELIQAARRDHADFIAKTARIAALLEHQDEDFHRDQIAGIRQQSSRMGGPGNS